MFSEKNRKIMENKQIAASSTNILEKKKIRNKLSFSIPWTNIDIEGS